MLLYDCVTDRSHCSLDAGVAGEHVLREDLHVPLPLGDRAGLCDVVEHRAFGLATSARSAHHLRVCAPSDARRAAKFESHRLRPEPGARGMGRLHQRQRPPCMRTLVSGATWYLFGTSSPEVRIQMPISVLSRPSLASLHSLADGRVDGDVYDREHRGPVRGCEPALQDIRAGADREAKGLGGAPLRLKLY